MKSILLAALLTLPAVGQAQVHLPIRKEKAKVAPVVAPQVVIHDTVIVYKTDTLSVFESALATPVVPAAAVPATCRNFFIPIPIPIPFSHSKKSSNATNELPTTTTPEPGSFILFGTGFVGLVAIFYIYRKPASNEN